MSCMTDPHKGPRQGDGGGAPVSVVVGDPCSVGVRVGAGLSIKAMSMCVWGGVNLAEVRCAHAHAWGG